MITSYTIPETNIDPEHGLITHGSHGRGHHVCIQSQDLSIEPRTTTMITSMKSKWLSRKKSSIICPMNIQLSITG